MLTTYNQSIADGITLPTLPELDALHAEGKLSPSRLYLSSDQCGDVPGWVWCMQGDGSKVPNSPGSLCYAYVDGEADLGPVPERVPRYEAKLWLLDHQDGDGASYWSKLKIVYNAMADGDDKERLSFGLNDARWWYRSDPLIEQMRVLLGMSQDDMDQAYRDIGFRY